MWISPKGAKSWRLKYTSPVTGKEATVTFGLYPYITLAKARALREEMKAKIAEGIDPRFDKEEQAAPIFEQVAKEWIGLQTHLSKSHHSKQQRRIELYLLPSLAKLPIDKITRKHIADIGVFLAKTDRVETARRVLSIASQIFKYAISRGIVDHNIVADIDTSMLLPKQKKKNFRTITDPDEIAALMQAIEDYPGHFTVGRALKALSYLVVRPGELRQMEWSDIEGDLWMIPAEKMKMKRPHTVPLPKQVRKIIEEMKPVSGDDRFVFPSVTHRNRPLSENTLNVALKRIGYGDAIVSHGFRAMFSTIAHERSGFTHEVIEAQLAHVVGSEVSRAYNRADYLEERRKLMQWWADWLDGL